MGGWRSRGRWARRAGRVMIWRRGVAARAVPGVRLIRVPAARSGLCAMLARSSQAPGAAKRPEGRWASGPSIRSAKTCSITACAWWVGSASPGGEGGVGGEGVVAQVGERLVVAGRVLTADPAHDQPGGELVFRPGESGVGPLGDPRVGDPALAFVVPDRLRGADRGPRLLGDGGDGGPRAGIAGHGDGEVGPGPTGRPTRRAPSMPPPGPRPVSRGWRSAGTARAAAPDNRQAWCARTRPPGLALP